MQELFPLMWNSSRYYNSHVLEYVINSTNLEKGRT